MSERPETSVDGLKALATLVREGTGLDPVTRQYLLFAWVCEQLAHNTPTALNDYQALATASGCVYVPDLLSVRRHDAWDLARLQQLLRQACQSLCPPAPQPLKGRLVTLEGGDGSGKTTQTQALAAALSAAGHPAVATRAIGGAGGGSMQLRAFILNPDFKWHSVAEALHTLAIYRETVARVIVPALAAGHTVVCDRLLDTALVYFRDDAIGLDAAALSGLYDILVDDLAPGLRPQLTFLLDLPYAEALQRRSQRSNGRLDRNEGKGERFHRYVFEEYRRQAAMEPRVVVIDARKPGPDLTRLLLARLEDLRVGEDADVGA